ncbi:MAG: glycosyltransferase [Planctomycetes bacterium]|nr:glycosyltransferase [Planctomycetota bacterium]
MTDSSIITLHRPAPANAARPRDLDIGVIYTHERQFMGPLVESLARSGDGLRMRLVLVDNASADGVDRWRNQFDESIVVRNKSRLGYAPNLNRILAVADARYVLLLNTDMMFEPDEQCLVQMVRFMDEHPQCGLSVCRLFHPTGEYGFPARQYQRLRTIAARRLPGGRRLAGTVHRYLNQHHSQYTEFECDWVSGCFMLLRREAIEQVGHLDTGFAKYFEDVDYCTRIRAAGWQVMFNGATYCYHFEQRASKRLLSRDAWLHLRSYGRWLRKWGLNPPVAPAVALPIEPKVPLRRAA